MKQLFERKKKEKWGQKYNNFCVENNFYNNTWEKKLQRHLRGEKNYKRPLQGKKNYKDPSKGIKTKIDTFLGGKKIEKDHQEKKMCIGICQEKKCVKASLRKKKNV